MKKIYSFISILALGLAAISCGPKDPTTGPDNGGDGSTKNPVLGEIAGCILDNAGAPLTTTYEAADFGAPVTINYALCVAKAGTDMAAYQQVKAEIAGGKISIAQLDLNNALLRLEGVEPDSEVVADFCLYAYVGSSINASALKSQIITATFTTCVSKVIDYESFNYVYAIGTFNNWAFESAPGDGVQQYLYDYTNTGVYEGTLYFAATAHQGWKISGVTGTWDDSCNWGFADSGDDMYEIGTEPESKTLMCAGGSKDMKAWAQNFYNFSFDRANLTLTVKKQLSWGDQYFPVAFEKMLLTGDFCGWADSEDGGAIRMNYDKAMHRFYCDLTDVEGGVAASGNYFGVKAIGINKSYDSTWRLQWGTTPGEGSKNVDIPESGNYRVYVDTNYDTVELSTSDYATACATGVEVVDGAVLVPEPSVWSLAGTFNGWAAEDETYNLTEIAHHEYVYYGLQLEAGAEFKVLGDHSWDECYGNGGDNFSVEEAGVYDITFNYDSKTISAQLCGAGWSVIGVVDGYSWTKDFEMTEADGVWTSAPLNITGEFKIRYRHDWAENRGAAEDGALEVGKPVSVNNGGANFSAAEGTYKVIYDSVNETVSIATAFPEHCYMIGAYCGWSWDTATEMVPVWGDPSKFWTVKYIKANDSFKFNTHKAWDGGEFFQLDNENIGGGIQGTDVVLPEDGLYMIMVDYTESVIVMEPAKIYGIGGCFDDSWAAGDERFLATVNAEGTASLTTVKGGEIRVYAAAPSHFSIDWWKMEFVFFDGQIAYRGNEGDQERVQVEGGKTVTFDFNAGTAVVE